MAPIGFWDRQKERPIDKSGTLARIDLFRIPIPIKRKGRVLMAISGGPICSPRKKRKEGLLSVDGPARVGVLEGH